MISWGGGVVGWGRSVVSRFGFVISWGRCVVSWFGFVFWISGYTFVRYIGDISIFVSSILDNLDTSIR